MIQMSTFIAILLVALTTYCARILGYVLLKNKTLNNRQRKILEVIPGCVLISMITPYFLRDDPADLIAIIVTLFVASRFGMLPTILISMASAAILRMLLV
ncbi:MULTISPECIES: AzlD family protein [unclassified Acinetobacter]|uniref:AzlD family protein n=1 Tax=unclassified Acinetobacter TaxID=196816 RepID=UPI0015D29C9F|nr:MULTISPECIES: AzlD family protein [unclassified Acinetobacter]